MDPKSVVKRIKEEGIDLVSITDHNSILNLSSYSEVFRKEGILFIYGMEVQTEEEVHILTYFNSFEEIKPLYEMVYSSLPYVKNNPEIFGDQVIIDKDGEIIGFEEKLLLNSAEISLRDILQIVKENNGVSILAHVESPFGILTQLGFIPDGLEFDFIEISHSSHIDEVAKMYPFLKEYKIVSFSDAHYLKDIGRSFTLFEFDKWEKNILKTLLKAKIKVVRRRNG